MRITLLILLFAFTSKAQIFYSPRDKNLHYIAGLGIGIVCGEIAYQITDDCAITMTSAFVPPVIAGAVKESHDGKRPGHTKSTEDFVVTAMGGAAAAFGLRIRIDCRRKKQQSKIIEVETDLYY